MSYSNRILLATIAVSVGLIAAIPITLRYKLDRQMWSSCDVRNNSGLTMKRFMGATHITLENIDEVTMIPGDTLIAGSDTTDAVKFFQRADTAFIQGNTPNKRVWIYAPTGTSIDAINATIILRGSLDPFRAPSYRFNLKQSKLTSGPLTKDWRMFQFINNVSVKGADGSVVDLAGSIRMQRLQLLDLSMISADSLVSIDDLRIEFSSMTSASSRSHNGKMMVKAQ